MGSGVEDTGFEPFVNGLIDISHGYCERDIVLVAEGFAEVGGCEDTLRDGERFRLLPEESGGLVERYHLVEVDERQRFANQDILVA